MKGSGKRIIWPLFVAMLLTVLVVAPASSEEFACCVQDRTGFQDGFCSIDAPYGNVFGVDDIDVCNNDPNFFAIQNQLCFPDAQVTAPLFPGCSIGCCCPTVDGNVADFLDASVIGPFTSDQCQVSSIDFPTYDWVFVPGELSLNSCADICGQPGEPFGGDATCESSGNYWCPEGESQGSLVDPALISDEDSNPPFLCYDAPCTTGNACLDAGGEFISQGFYCESDFVNGIDNCCNPSDISQSTCSVIDSSTSGIQCSTDFSCVGDDYTSLLLPGVIPSGNVCCQDLGGTSASCSSQVCTPTYGYTTEIYCADGVDNDCDGLVDASDNDCSATIRGVVDNFITGSPQEGIFLNLEATIDPAIPGEVYTVLSDGNGAFRVDNVASGDYEVSLTTGQNFYTIVPSESQTNFALTSSDDRFIRIVVTEQGLHTLTGTVTDADTLLPLPGTRVFLQGTQLNTFTNDAGQYVLTSVPPNQYNVRAFKEGYRISPNYGVDLTIDAVQDFALEPLVCSSSLDDLSFSLEHILGEFSVQVLWGDLGCNVLDAELQKCFGTLEECQSTSLPNSNFVTITSLSDFDGGSFIDELTTNDSTYSYVVKVTRFDYTESFSEPKQIFTGNWQCEGATSTSDQFCLKEFDILGEELLDEGYICTPENIARIAEYRTIPTQCGGPDLTCTEFRDDVNGPVFTQCIASSDGCSGLISDPFNLYSYEEGDNICSNFPGCYYDRGQTNVNTCVACTAQTVCSTYKTEYACTQDACQVSPDIPSCEWVSINDDLGVGVCKSADEEASDCEACNSGQSIFGACPGEDVCENQFGTPGTANQCHYDTLTSLCTSCSTNTCYGYLSEEQCLGDDLEPGTFNFATLTYDDEDSGACDFGNCKYDEPSGICYRDANDDNSDDCSSPSFRENEGHGFSILECRANKEAPQTILSVPAVYNAAGENQLFFIATDDYHGPEWIDTYFCIEAGDLTEPFLCNDFPQFAKTSGNTVFIDGLTYPNGGLSGDTTYSLAGGDNTVFFFSTDVFNNLEPMKRKVLVVDETGPEIQLTIDVLPTDTTSDVLLSAVTNEPASCILELSLVDDGSCYNNNCATPTAVDLFHQRSIFGVTDGIYTILAQCTDLSGNVGEQIITQQLDADSRASNPQPSGVIDYTDICLRVRTTLPTECKYSETLLPYDSIPSAQILDEDPSYVSGGGYYDHVHCGINLPPNQGYQYYYVCAMQPPAIEFTQFVIDTLAPTALVSTPIGEQFTPNGGPYAVPDGQLIVSCEDSPFGGFGCADISLCTTPANTNCNPVSQGVTQTQLTVAGNTKVCVRATERSIDSLGGKSSAIQCYEFLSDNAPPVLILDEYPTITQTEQFTITGRVLDYAYVGSSWIPEEDASSIRDTFIVPEEEATVKNFLLNASLISDFSTQNIPVFDLVFRYLSPTAYYALRVDGNNQNPSGQLSAYLISHTAGGDTPLTSQDNFIDWQGSGMPVSVTIDGTSIDVQLGSYDLSATVGSLPGWNGAQIGVISDTGSAVEVTDIVVFDNDRDQTNNKVEFFRRRGESTTPTDLEPARPEFTIETSLLSNTVGDVTEFVLRGVDFAGRTSPYQSIFVTLDNDNPVIHGFNVYPLDSTTPASSVIYQDEFILGVQVSDRGTYTNEFVESVLVDIGPYTSLELTYDASFGEWIATLDASSFSAIGFHTLSVTATDLADRSTTRDFIGTSSLFIEDPLNTFATRQFSNPLFTAQPNPQLAITTSDAAICSVTYDSTSGSQSQQFVTSDDVTHQAIISSPLACSSNEEIESLGTVTCTGVEQYVENIVFVCDQRPPVIAGLIEQSLAYQSFANRTHKELSVLSGLGVPIEVHSDEPTQCRYCVVGGDETCTRETAFADMSLGLTSGDLYSMQHDISGTGFFMNEFREEIIVSCVDRATNPSRSQSITLFDASYGFPAVFGSGPTHSSSFSTSIYVDIQAPDASCLVRDTDTGDAFFVDRAMNTVNQLNNGLRRLSTTVAFPSDGEYALEIVCQRNVNGLQSSITPLLVSIDQSQPSLTVDDSGSLSSSSISLQAAIANVDVLEVYRRSQLIIQQQVTGESSFTLPIGLLPGSQDLVIKAKTIHGAESDVTVLAQFPSTAPLLELEGLRSYSVQKDLSSLSVIVSSDQYVGSVSGTTVEVFLLTSSGLSSLGQQSVTDDGLYTFIVPDLTQEGTHSLYAELRRDSSVLAANNYLVHINPLAENVVSVEPQTSVFVPGQLVAAAEYESLITSATYSFNDILLPTLVDRGEILALLQQSTFTNYSLALENDLGEVTSLSGVSVTDQESPFIQSWSILGSEGVISRSRLPAFSILFNEPVKFSNVYLNSHPEIELDYSNEFAQEHIVSVSSATPLQLEGLYRAVLVFEDLYANSVEDRSVQFTYTQGNLTLTLQEPQYGWSDARVFDVVLNSDRDAICRYANGNNNVEFAAMTEFTSTDGRIHRIDDYEITTSSDLTGTRKITVKCQDNEGTDPDDTRTVFDLGWDLTPPTLSTIEVVPSVNDIVIEPVSSVEVVAITNEPVICTYRLDGGSWLDSNVPNYVDGVFSDTFGIRMPIVDGSSYNVDLLCLNRAELTVEGSTSFSVDFSLSAGVIITSPASGGHNQSIHAVEARTNKQIDFEGCAFTINNGARRDFDFYATDRKLVRQDDVFFDEGSNILKVYCMIEGEEQSSTIPVIIDMDPPQVLSLSTETVWDDPDYFRFSVNATDETDDFPGSGLSSLQYILGLVDTFGDIDNVTAAGTVDWDSDTYTISGLDLALGQTYFVDVRVQDNAGHWSDYVRSEGTLIVEGSDDNSCFDGVLSGLESGVDCGGICDALCPAGETCSAGFDCLSGVCNLGVCTGVTTCSNGIQDYNESDIDCGGPSCLTCDDGATCSEDSDCSSNWCNSGTCEASSCSDGLTNGFESDVDCGGTCGACSAGQSCNVFSDCDSSICTDGQCSFATCSDGVQNGDETDVDCGGSCLGCYTGQKCSFDADCEDGTCSFGTCSDGSSSNSQQDSDNDGIPDEWELRYGLDPNDPLDADIDIDADGLTNIEEYQYVGVYGSLDPTLGDTDGDSHDDGVERDRDTDASDPNDFPEAKLLSIILFIIAFILIGGSLGVFGYYSYVKQHNPKKGQQKGIPPMNASAGTARGASAVIPPMHTSRNQRLVQALQHTLKNHRKSHGHSGISEKLDALGDSPSTVSNNMKYGTQRTRTRKKPVKQISDPSEVTSSSPVIEKLRSQRSERSAIDTLRQRLDRQKKTTKNNKNKSKKNTAVKKSTTKKKTSTVNKKNSSKNPTGTKKKTTKKSTKQKS